MDLCKVSGTEFFSPPYKFWQTPLMQKQGDKRCNKDIKEGCDFNPLVPNLASKPGSEKWKKNRFPAS